MSPVVVLGATEALPWVDGVNYLGRDPDAPRLLLPTMLRPAVAVDAVRAGDRPPCGGAAEPLGGAA